MNIVLLGDSIFDNESYVPDGPCVTQQLQKLLGPKATVTLLAVDGDVTADVHRQSGDIPANATHLVVSCGGNDALRESNVLFHPAESVSEALEKFVTIREEFRSRYSTMLGELCARILPFASCTVYDSVPGLEGAASAALSMFNEVILRESLARSVSLIDLRIVCDEADDYSEISPIEPSVRGGDKIARAISRFVEEGENGTAHARVYV